MDKPLERDIVIKFVSQFNKAGVKLRKEAMEELAEALDIRVCSQCGNLMWFGFCISGGVEYYCTDECLHESGISDEEFRELYDGDDDTYWTEWI